MTHTLAGTALVALIERVAAGDDLALSALHAATRERLLAVASRLLTERADAEEVVSDVYLQVWRTAAQYDPTRGSVRLWLSMICRSRAIDHRRRNETVATCHTNDPSGAIRSALTLEPDELVDSVQQRASIRRALKALPPLRRRVFALSFFDEMSHMQIAAATELALGTVKSHLRRAVCSVREELRDQPALEVSTLERAHT